MNNNFCPHGLNCCCNMCRQDWPAATGPVGPRGATGAQGPAGERGPQGPQGVPGPQGATGAQGPAGAQGLRGATGAAGAAGVPGPAGERGPAGDQGPRGEAGLPGPTGSPGQQGAAGLPGPQGTQGVTGPPGPSGIQGEQGPVGPTGPVASIIPFSLNKYGVNLAADDGGNPYGVAFSGFGATYMSPVYLEQGEWATGTISVTSGTGYPTAFILPRDAVLRRMYVLVSMQNRDFEVGVTVRPFVCLAVSDVDPLQYRILTDTTVFTEPYVGGVIYPDFAVKRGEVVNFDHQFTEGQMVAIVIGIATEGADYQIDATFAANGGLYLE